MKKFLKFLVVIIVAETFLSTTTVLASYIFLFANNGDTIREIFWIDTISCIIRLIVLLLVAKKLDNNPETGFMSYKKLKSDSWKFIILGLGLPYIGVVFYDIFIALVDATPEVINTYSDYFATFEVKNTIDVAMIVINLVILTPLTEELLSRGLVFDVLKRDFKIGTAIFLSSLFFASTHMYPSQIVYAFILGLILCYIYYERENIFEPMIVHGIANATAILNAPFEKNPIYIVVSLLAIAYGLYFLLQLRKNQPKQRADFRKMS